MLELTLRDTGALAAMLSELQALPSVVSAEATGEGIRIFARQLDGLLPLVVSAAQGAGLRDLAIHEPSLETVFLRLTGRELRD